MSLDVIPEAIHKYMHENLNDSQETEEQKTIGNFDKWITKFNKTRTSKVGAISKAQKTQTS